MPIEVSTDVLDGIEYVRNSGETNMFDYNAVMRIAFEANYYETVNWMVEHKSEYVKGIFSGFEPVDATQEA